LNTEELHPSLDPHLNNSTHPSTPTDSNRIAEYDMKLMDVDSDTLNIPDTDYDARVTTPSSESSVTSHISFGASALRPVKGARFASDGESLRIGV
jgi:hypothetical protein